MEECYFALKLQALAFFKLHKFSRFLTCTNGSKSPLKF